MNFLKKFTVVALAAVAITACSDDNTGTSATVGGPKIRVVNSAYVGDSALITTGSISTTLTATPLDFMVDSAATGTNGTNVLPTAFDDIPGNSIAGLTIGSTVSGTATSSTYDIASNTGFQEFDVGVHSFVARAADSVLTGNKIQFYTNNTTASSAAPYLPRQYLTSGTYYTFVISGTAPVNTFPGSGAIPFTALVDDPFPPPTLSNGTYQARFRVINAAPYNATTGSGSGTGATVQIYMVPSTSTAPSVALANYTPLGSAGHRAASSYINVTAGTYWLTLANGTTNTSIVVFERQVTLAAGEVRTFILQQSNATNISSMQATGSGIALPTAPAVTNQSIFKVTNILDQQY